MNEAQIRHMYMTSYVYVMVTYKCVTMTHSYVMASYVGAMWYVGVKIEQVCSLLEEITIFCPEYHELFQS